MNKIRFWIALWAGKFFTWLYKHIGRERDDRPGMLSMKLFIRFLTYVSKPPLTICVSGTNGKTSISILLADMFKKAGFKVSSNDWGANANAGHARLLLDSVSIFNKSNKDVAVIETDELLASFSVPQMKPDYFIINNLGRDSMFRNANPEYILDHVSRAAKDTPNAVLVINGDDPLCAGIGDQNRKIYFGVTDVHKPRYKHAVDDYAYCLQCGAKPVYRYRNYRHIGDYYCPACGMEAPERDYFVTEYDETSMSVREKDGSVYTYPILSDVLHNIYNTATIISVFRDLGYAPEKVAELLSSVQITKSRETNDKVGSIELLTRASKGQNPTSASTIVESLREIQGKKELVLLYDEELAAGHFETVSWIYDTDFEILNDPDITKIIVAGARYLDHKLRLLMAGIDAEKIVAIKEPKDAVNYVSCDDIDKIIVVHDIFSIETGAKVKQQIKEKLEKEQAK